MNVTRVTGGIVQHIHRFAYLGSVGIANKPHWMIFQCYSCGHAQVITAEKFWSMFA